MAASREEIADTPVLRVVREEEPGIGPGIPTITALHGAEPAETAPGRLVPEGVVTAVRPSAPADVAEPKAVGVGADGSVEAREPQTARQPAAIEVVQGRVPGAVTGPGQAGPGVTAPLPETVLHRVRALRAPVAAIDDEEARAGEGIPLPRGRLETSPVHCVGDGEEA